MEGVMDPLVVAVGTALVTAMATEAWGQAKGGVLRSWRRFSPSKARDAELELDRLRRLVWRRVSVGMRWPSRR